jgi:hypothetical protein
MRVMKRNPVGHYRIAEDGSQQSEVDSRSLTAIHHLDVEWWPFSAVADTQSEGQRQRITMRREISRDTSTFDGNGTLNIPERPGGRMFSEGPSFFFLKQGDAARMPDDYLRPVYAYRSYQHISFHFYIFFKNSISWIGRRRGAPARPSLACAPGCYTADYRSFSFVC